MLWKMYLFFLYIYIYMLITGISSSFGNVSVLIFLPIVPKDED
jgi:tellurite resistance protein TehA-like permease